MIQDLLSVFFPNLCAGCQQPMVSGETVVCTDCLIHLPFTDFHITPDNPVEKMFWGRTQLNAAMALMYFNKGNRVQRLLHQMKYHGNLDVGLTLGRMLGSRIKQSERFANINKVIPVPLHPKKQKTRGFNQSELIARGIAEETGIELSTTLLTRVLNNPTQTKKARFERYENVTGAFAIAQLPEDKPIHVLLVDDVVTTGSTLESCINALNTTGKITVSLCVAACAE